jgi:putative oxidoreductase
MTGSRGSTLGWTLVRGVFGLALGLAHGLPKVMGDMGRFAQGVAELGFPYPLYFAWAASLAELVGGLFVAVGFLTRPAAFFAAFTLAVALYRHRMDDFGRMELAVLYLAVFVAAVFIGGGPLSVDARMRRRPF